MTLLLTTSCEEKIQQTRGKIKKMTDSTIVATIDKYDVVFDSKQAKFDVGAVMTGDSIKIHYIGNLRDKKAKAVLVALIPRIGNTITIGFDPSKELKTGEMTEEEKETLHKATENGKKLQR